MKENATRAKDRMVERVNAKSNPLSVAVGDYVYLLRESSKIGQKLQNKYDGPFVIDSIESAHLVILVDPVSGKKLHRSVHLDRLKFAYVRQPNPLPYLPDTVVTKVSIADTAPLIQSDVSHRGCIEEKTDQMTSSRDNQPCTTPMFRRSRRLTRAPDRYMVWV